MKRSIHASFVSKRYFSKDGVLFMDWVMDFHGGWETIGLLFRLLVRRRVPICRELHHSLQSYHEDMKWNTSSTKRNYINKIILGGSQQFLVISGSYTLMD